MFLIQTGKKLETRLILSYCSLYPAIISDWCMGNSEFSVLNSWLSRLDLGFYICDHRTLLVHFMNYSDVELSYSNAGFENT